MNEKNLGLRENCKFHDPVNARRRRKFSRFMYSECPKSDLVMKVRIRDSFK